MIIEWLFNNYIEILGVIASLVYLYFSVRQNIWTWPFGIIASLLYVLVFFEAGFYADMSLQVYYFFISIYGWYFWVYGKKKGENKLRVGSLRRKEWIVYIFLTLILTFVAGYFLKKISGSLLPYLDAFTTSASILATWMLARKIIDTWLFWIVIDMVSIGMYIYKGLYPTIILFVVYTIMAVIGYYQWKKDLKNGV